MPLLPAEPISHPEHLFESNSGTRRWWVFQTRPRSEKSFARLLRKFGTAYFLPQTTHRWRRGTRWFESHIPLFSGYVFACGDESARKAAFATKLLANEIAVPDQCQLDCELATIHHLLVGGGSLRPESGLAEGTLVRVVGGTYSGIQGRLVAAIKDDELRVRVEVSLLGQGVSVPVERWMVQTIDTNLARNNDLSRS